jgi:S1-C subfamily serine protease
MRSSRRGSGVVVSLDGAGGDLRVLTAAHVACLAGPNNRVDVRASASFADARTRVGSVVAVHPRLDLALIKLDDLPDALDPSETDEPFPSTFAPLAAAPPPVGARVAALGYAMGWSSAFRTAMRRRAGDSAAGVWGHLLATHEEAFFDFGEDEHDEEDSGAPKIAEFVLHTASVASGCSGGPLVSEAGEVIGVHSFGDAFYGGARDVAVATPRRVVESLGGYGSKTKREKKKRTKPASPETYATATVLAAIFASSDPALAAMCPELTPEQRKAWIL